MANTTNRYKNPGDPTEDLQIAIQKLERYSEQRATETHPHDQENPKPENILQKTIRFAKNFLATTFSGKARERQEEKKKNARNEILSAIEVVTSKYLLIQRLITKGTPEQKKLAESAMNVVQKYNSMLDKAKQLSPTWSTRISRFVYEQCGIFVDPVLHAHPIHLPEPAAVQYQILSSDKKAKKINQKLDSPLTAASSQKISCLVQTTHIQPEIITQQEADLFRVKAISLLLNNGIRFKSSKPDVLHSIKSTPIHVTINSSDTSENSQEVLMKQVLKPLPGEKIIVTGVFERACHTTLKHSMPLTDSFQITSKSDQTGFPHPSQHNGWGLIDVMIPACPQRLDLLVLFTEVYHKKQEIARELLPKGSLNAKAKDLLQLKRETFNANKQELLKLHHELNTQMIHAAYENGLCREGKKVLENYFQEAAQASSSFDFLSEVQEIVITNFILRPYEHFKEEWLEHKNPGLTDQEPKIRFQTAATIMESERLKAKEELRVQRQNVKTEVEAYTLDYVCLMADIIGIPSRMILLQHLSESIGFAPPMFNNYEQMIQAALYKQLQAFQHELISENVEIYEHLIKELQTDIDLFKTESLDDLKLPFAEIVRELEFYFNSRYYAYSSRKNHH